MQILIQFHWVFWIQIKTQATFRIMDCDLDTNPDLGLN